MLRLLKTLLLFLAAVSAGCVYSQHSLSNEKTARVEPRLLGTWASVKEGEPHAWFAIGRKKGTDNTMELVNFRRREDDSIKVKRQTWYVGPGDENYVSWRVETKEGKPAFLLMNLEFPAEDTMHWHLLDLEFLGDAVVRGDLQGRVERHDVRPSGPGEANDESERAEEKRADVESAPYKSVFLTDSPEAILKFLEEHGAQCFEEEPKVFERVSG